jgi:hypothetical protein
MSGAGADNSRERRSLLGSAASFLREKYPYLLGFAAIEGGIYYFNGPTGNFTTGFIGLFAIWIFYAWMSRE